MCEDQSTTYENGEPWIKIPWLIITFKVDVTNKFNYIPKLPLYTARHNVVRPSLWTAMSHPSRCSSQDLISYP